MLWGYNVTSDEANRTAKFISTEITAEGIPLQFYSLSYIVQHIEYNLTLYTTLTPLDSETYNSSFTIMNYAPAGKSEITSLELVEFNLSVTLSQQYAVLGKVAKELGKVYKKSGDETLAQFAEGYYIIEKEAKGLSKLVKKQLQEYDKEILRSSAILMNYGFWECLFASIVCGAAIGAVIGCAIATLGVGFIACLATVFGVSTGAVWVAIATGAGVIGACVIFCCCVGYQPCCL
ncbi:MAG: hypothetical protein ACUVQY_10530 [Thermoproteota archaeon]